jgi:hypothetical protein
MYFPALNFSLVMSYWAASPAQEYANPGRNDAVFRPFVPRTMPDKRRHAGVSMFDACNRRCSYGGWTAIGMTYIKSAGFALALLLLAGASFYLTSKWLAGAQQRPSPRASSAPLSRPAVAPTDGTYCELTFPVGNCPAYPGMYKIDAKRQLLDTWEGSDKSLERCLNRAQEYRAYCKFDGTVTARFVSGGRTAGTRSVP